MFRFIFDNLPVNNNFSLELSKHALTLLLANVLFFFSGSFTSLPNWDMVIVEPEALSLEGPF